jgi:predicted nucleic acid-binding protein
MGLLENLQDHLKKLPEDKLNEILELVSALEKKEEHREIDESTVWSTFSLESAMSNIDIDEGELYTLKDLKETYR